MPHCVKKVFPLCIAHFVIYSVFLPQVYEPKNKSKARVTQKDSQAH